MAGGFLARWLHQSPIFGYLLAGVAIGPFTPGFVGDREQTALLADAGVIFLMFSLEVAFSLKDLPRVRATATIGHHRAGGIDDRRWPMAGLLLFESKFDRHGSWRSGPSVARGLREAVSA